MQTRVCEIRTGDRPLISCCLGRSWAGDLSAAVLHRPARHSLERRNPWWRGAANAQVFLGKGRPARASSFE